MVSLFSFSVNHISAPPRFQLCYFPPLPHLVAQKRTFAKSRITQQNDAPSHFVCFEAHYFLTFLRFTFLLDQFNTTVLCEQELLSIPHKNFSRLPTTWPQTSLHSPRQILTSNFFIFFICWRKDFYLTENTSTSISGVPCLFCPRIANRIVQMLAQETTEFLSNKLLYCERGAKTTAAIALFQNRYAFVAIFSYHCAFSTKSTWRGGRFAIYFPHNFLGYFLV